MPAATETTLDSPGGTLVWPKPSPKVWSPQATTVPLLLRARKCEVPAAIPMTFDKPGGTSVALPHSTSVPSVFKARLFPPPAAIAVALFKPKGTFVAVIELPAQAVIVPLGTKRLAAPRDRPATLL